MSTKCGIYHSGNYVDGQEHFYLYFDMADNEIHLDYRGDDGRWEQMILPKALITALKADPGRGHD